MVLPRSPFLERGTRQSRRPWLQSSGSSRRGSRRRRVLAAQPECYALFERHSAGLAIGVLESPCLHRLALLLARERRSQPPARLCQRQSGLDPHAGRCPHGTVTDPLPAPAGADPWRVRGIVELRQSVATPLNNQAVSFPRSCRFPAPAGAPYRAAWIAVSATQPVLGVPADACYPGSYSAIRKTDSCSAGLYEGAMTQQPESERKQLKGNTSPAGNRERQPPAKWWKSSSFWGHTATIVGTILGLVALGVGGLRFSQTQTLTREAKAVDLYVKYNEIMQGAEHKWGVASSWSHNIGLTIAEAILILRPDDYAWRKTVKRMLGNHRDFVTKEKLDCGTFSDEFKAAAAEA
jgi:hypothetical protein